MKLTKRAERAGVSPRFVHYLLRGERNASSPLALRLAELTHTAPELWVFGTPEERRNAWNKAKEAQP